MNDPARQNPLQTSVQFVKGVGEARAALLARMGIRTVEDLLLTLPRRYEDRRRFQPMGRLRTDEMATVAGRILACDWVQPRRGKAFFEAVLGDETGVVDCRWYGAAYLRDQLGVGDRLVAFGKVSRLGGRFAMQHPEFEAINEDEESLHVNRIVPIYPLTEDLSQKTMRRIMHHAVEWGADEVEEVLPESVRRRHRLPEARAATRDVHFPETMASVEKSRKRLVFEEFLCMQLVLAARKVRNDTSTQGIRHVASGSLRGQMLAALPFALTSAQDRVRKEIASDMAAAAPMHRLLQGDVGSGKTVVAACAILDAIEGGSQAAVLAPTEVLAAQHAETLSGLLEPAGVDAILLTGDVKGRARTQVLEGIEKGQTGLVVGTHALLQEGVVFRGLGLVVIDEQHKFGVEQRAVLYAKGTRPDVLVMTATPIPRTLAMTLYGDLDVSILDELPQGRGEIITRVIRRGQLPDAYRFIQKQVAKGRQAYMVYPRVTESDHIGVRAARQMYDQLRDEVFHHEEMALLHGQLSSEEKRRIMQSFRQGQTKILIATTVVEVGLDVPNATIMLVEHAERFGLAQLHQLRGRVGRGARRSYCLLEGDPSTPESWRRLQVMKDTTDGFRIAEEDLLIRGMGDLLGRAQSGLPELRVGHPVTDAAVLEAAREEAFRLLKQFPRLDDPSLTALRRRACRLYRERGLFAAVG